MDGLLLLGPPAVGKDTITDLLLEISQQLALFRKYKAGAGRTHGYRLIDRTALLDLQARGQLVSLVSRYGNLYAVDQQELRRIQLSGAIPIVHTASLEEWHAVGPTWHRVVLWQSRQCTRRRLLARGDNNSGERLALYDSLAQALPLLSDTADLVIRTDLHQPTLSADLVLSLLAVKSAIDRPPALPVVLAAPTLGTPEGTPDWTANEAYASALADSGRPVLVGGSTGGGGQLAPTARRRLYEVWLGALGRDKAVLCIWGLQELRLLAAEGYVGSGQSVVVALSEEESQHPEAVRDVHADAMIYSHPRFGWQLQPHQVRGVAGVKVSKATARAIADLRSAVGPDIRIWHGTAQDIYASLIAGASAVVSYELAVVPPTPAPTSLQPLQSTIRDVRARVQSTTTKPKSAYLSSLVREWI